MQKIVSALILGAALAVTVAARTAAAPAPHATAQPFDLGRSHMTVYVYKEGLFAFAADNHVIDAPIASGSYDASAQSVSVTVDASKLRVLDHPSVTDKPAVVQANTIGPQVLDAAKYPTISFRSTKITAADEGHLAVDGLLTLHGVTRPISLRVTRADDHHFTGSASIKQTDFGITPIRIAGGTVRVKDVVRIDFDIALK